jgi:hypothetical protein
MYLMCAYHVGQGEVEAVVHGVLVGGRLLHDEERVEEGVEAVLVRAHRAQLAAEVRGEQGRKSVWVRGHKGMAADRLALASYVFT